MKQGHFYFVKDEFYNRFNDPGLVYNKGNQHNRPCFFAFKDNKSDILFWLIPISSKVDKYKKIVNNKIQHQKSRNNKHPKCNTIVFGRVRGRSAAFLIQNMFPVTEEYIKEQYIDKTTNAPIRVTNNLEKDIIRNARQVISLYRKGHQRLLFADIGAIEKALTNDHIRKESALPKKTWCEKTLQSAQKLADAHNLNNDMPEIDDDGSR